MPKKKKKTDFDYRDIRLLRERLVWSMKYLPETHKKFVLETLSLFAKRLEKKCCEETVYVEQEKKIVCLNCGKRSAPKKSKLEVIK